MFDGNVVLRLIFEITSIEKSLLEKKKETGLDQPSHQIMLNKETLIFSLFIIICFLKKKKQKKRNKNERKHSETNKNGRPMFLTENSRKINE